jgi:polysaccharide pyruvyl transferase WcaK-like protein
MKTIFIINEANGAKNLGDDAMFEVITEALEENDYRIVTSSINGGTDNRFEQVIPVSISISKIPLPSFLVKLVELFRYFLSEILVTTRIGIIRKLALADPQVRHYYNFIDQVDAVVFSGTGSMNSKYSLSGVYRRGIITNLAFEKKKSIVIVGNGVGPLSHINKLVAKRYIHKIDLIFVRDRVKSKSELLSINYDSKKIFERIDDAFYLKSSEEDDNYAKKYLFRLNGNKFIVINLHNWNKFISHSLIEMVTKFALNHSDYSFLLIPNQILSSSLDDRVILGKLKKTMENYKLKVFLVEDNITPGQAKSLIRSAVMTISTRYHIGVFSLSVGVPTILIYLDGGYYYQKMLGILDWYDLSSFAVSFRDQINFIKMCKSLLDDIDNIRKKIDVTNSNFENQGYEPKYRITNIIEI